MNIGELKKDMCAFFSDVCPNSFICFCGEKHSDSVHVPQMDADSWENIKKILKAFEDEI